MIYFINRFTHSLIYSLIYIHLYSYISPIGSGNALVVVVEGDTPTHASLTHSLTRHSPTHSLTHSQFNKVELIQ